MLIVILLSVFHDRLLPHRTRWTPAGRRGTPRGRILQNYRVPNTFRIASSYP